MHPVPQPDPSSGRNCDARRRFFDHVPLDAALARLAEAQHGVVTVRQLEELGLSQRAVQHRAAAGRLHRLHHGVYALMPRPLLKREGHWMAAVLAGGPGAVLSHRSAAALHGLRAYGSSKVEVIVPTRSARSRPGLSFRRVTTLAEEDVTDVDGIPCTSVARALLDLGAVAERRAVERACDQAEISQVFDLRALRSVLERNPRHPGARKLIDVLVEHYIGATPTWNEFEDAFLAITRRLGLPDPEVNQLLDLHDGEPPLQPDFLWRRLKLAVETDGRGTHRTRQAFERDRRRSQRLTVAGWRPLAFTWRQVFRRPVEVERTLLALTA